MSLAPSWLNKAWKQLYYSGCIVTAYSMNASEWCQLGVWGESKEIAARSFQSRKAALLLLGVASGLPLFLTSKTLQAWMTVENVNLGAIGLFSLVSLPYSLKFLWAPLLDRFTLPFWDGGAVVWFKLRCYSDRAISKKPAQTLQLLAVNA